MKGNNYKTYKITLREFWDNKEDLSIHCDTEEKANKLLKAFDKMGKRWNGGDSYLDENCFVYYGGKICYQNDGYCSGTDTCIKRGYTIYEFDEVDLEEEQNNKKTNASSYQQTIAMFNAWYNVTYIPDLKAILNDSVNNYVKYGAVVKQKLRLDNVNGWSKGYLYFANEEGKLVFLNWKQVLCITPCKE